VSLREPVLFRLEAIPQNLLFFPAQRAGVRQWASQISGIVKTVGSDFIHQKWIKFAEDAILQQNKSNLKELPWLCRSKKSPR
jgi:hypothetical protein